MLYAFLCFGDEAVDGSLSRDEEAAMIAKIHAVQDKVAADGRSGPSIRLMPTTTATTLRAGREPLVLDGPFAETKEQIAGVWVLDCATLEEALEVGRQWAREKPSGALEIRPVAHFTPGVGLK